MNLMQFWHSLMSKSRFWRSCWWVVAWTAFPTATLAQVPGFPPPIPNQYPSSPTVPVVGADTYFEGYTYDNVPFPPRLSQNSTFIVLVFNEGSGVWEKVRRVAKDARLSSDPNFIQAGAFRYGDNALNQTRELERQGLRVQIMERDGTYQRVVYSRPSGVGQLPNVSSPPPTRPPVASRRCQDERVQSVRGLAPREYVVVIPSEEETVVKMCDEVAKIVALNSEIIIRNSPIGLHIAVGSFGSLTDARNWESRLREKGFANARVVYNR